MDRIGSLIEKLNMQLSRKVPLSQLLSTVQMLQNEIAGSMREVNVLGTSGISVMVPNVKPLADRSLAKDMEAAGPTDSAEKEYYELVVEGGEEEEHPAEISAEIPSYEELIKLQQEIKASEKQARLSFIDDTTEQQNDTPTLSRQGKPAASKAAKQASTPKAGRNSIKDLHKAIGAQDRIVFVRELFRGDEVMFERSIKTINNFSSLAHAEYWIERELKTKNGWLPGNPTTQQFEQLVKRRFS